LKVDKKGGEIISDTDSKKVFGNRTHLEPSGERTYRPRQRPDLRSRLVEGEMVVLDRREEFIHQLNCTASYIWELCDGLHTPDEISQELCSAFNTDFSTAQRDVLATVEKLREAKLLDGD